MNDADKQKRVYELLLTPIGCDKKIKTISLKDGCILSGQKYISSYADPDMSDFAVGFYEILYRELLDGVSMLDNSYFFVNTDFAGDTMNSFNSIANATPGVGASATVRLPFEKWPVFLREYYRQYRCLANFWVIPMKLGRQSMKFNRFDAMDLCLDTLKKNYTDRMAIYTDYIARIPDFDHLCRAHLITAGRDKGIIKSLYQNKGGEKLAALATEDIKQRAKRIARSPFSEELFDYFSALGLT